MPRQCQVLSDSRAEPEKQHWAYRPIKDSPPPTVADPEWNQTAIDRFVRAKLTDKALTPFGLASRRDLLRRVTYDLTGLPPTPSEMAKFLKDELPNSFEKVVDRLLETQSYGEHWGRHWLDVVRYADTAGDASDYPAPAAWRYRDYVIDSFRHDKPFDQFLQEQIAGDLLPASGADDRAEKLVGIPAFEWALRVLSLRRSVPDLSSPSRVRFAARCAPWTAPGRSEATTYKRERTQPDPGV